MTKLGTWRRLGCALVLGLTFAGLWLFHPFLLAPFSGAWLGWRYNRWVAAEEVMRTDPQRVDDEVAWALGRKALPPGVHGSFILRVPRVSHFEWWTSVPVVIAIQSRPTSTAGVAIQRPDDWVLGFERANRKREVQNYVEGLTNDPPSVSLSLAGFSAGPIITRGEFRRDGRSDRFVSRVVEGPDITAGATTFLWSCPEGAVLVTAIGKELGDSARALERTEGYEPCSSMSTVDEQKRSAPATDGATSVRPSSDPELEADLRVIELDLEAFGSALKREGMHAILREEVPVGFYVHRELRVYGARERSLRRALSMLEETGSVYSQRGFLVGDSGWVLEVVAFAYRGAPGTKDNTDAVLRHLRVGQYGIGSDEVADLFEGQSRIFSRGVARPWDEPGESFDSAFLSRVGGHLLHPLTETELRARLPTGMKVTKLELSGNWAIVEFERAEKK